MEEEGKKALALQQRQLLMQQRQQQIQLLQRQQQQQQQQQAMARFPSNIDAHLRAPGMRPHLLQPQHQPLLHQQQQQQQQQPPPPVTATVPPTATASALPGRLRPGNSIEAEMVHQDVMNVCNPDFKRPFSSVEDAVLRLLPYHVMADYEAEEDDRILDSDTTGQIPSRLQQWDHNILAKIAELTATFEKQVLAFNIMSRKRAVGEFRSEEKLMVEQALLQEEKQLLLALRAEVELREKAGREAAAAEARMRLAAAQAEHARAEAHTQAEMAARMPQRAIRANAAASHSEVGVSNMMVQQQQQQGGNEEDMGEGDEDPSDDFLNDENEQENGDVAGQEWQNDTGELDLNSR
ncbi:mediator of RNA polymerase II transcription subunit 15 [Phalaenopsis equestris]|uniref:mediator of RNA polymerase II transcription subunit 15 n=1 Tax=Phalaenopsis equestris TaxID=78828 RepID=UPI0009E4DF4F|nr:mediator of RNA polymerase II transcription subunit 15 [Phalaenopsis equestris]XP_020591642.1 mediator of RNA polymerase II transcription subunit 15 [Phalaenopsis equestris]XP_020591650.1 mediator of RNA polymerase II transcription subunit 15 [Phalaenopsis equestris]XP_020591658.1 mediator of RNA polymerase II transcription subunit 15 [Phalaenopsis equestris]XP_020591666.1 mediator of RNA polymerase II transcription subunit 15 [Phalaenopsis equestris]XP_020591673.1 mediator of RNA polymeras